MPYLFSPTSRRQFLTAAGATMAGLAIAPRVAAAQPADSRPLRLALLSDTHIPADAAETFRGFAPVENLSKVVPQVLAANVDGALVGGDLARLEGLPADYARLRDLMAPVTAKLPVGLVLGNHDHRANFLAAFEATPSALKGKVAATREAGGLRFILLDSLLAPNVTPGQLGSAQRQWLAAELAASASPTVLLVHHTLGEADGELVDAERLFDVVRPHRHVKAMMYGHSHRYEVRERDGIQLINLPAVAYNFADTEPVGWVESVWTPDGVDLSLRAVGGSMAANGQTTSVHWSR